MKKQKKTRYFEWVRYIDYWIVNREEFKVKGILYRPIITFENIEDARKEKEKLPDVVIVKNLYDKQRNRRWQQIAR